MPIGYPVNSRNNPMWLIVFGILLLGLVLYSYSNGNLITTPTTSGSNTSGSNTSGSNNGNTPTNPSPTSTNNGIQPYAPVPVTIGPPTNTTPTDTSQPVYTPIKLGPGPVRVS
jgi:hypothetical protein